MHATSVTAPTPFGRYTLVRRIGQGGMGEVFLARENNAGNIRAVVVKKVLPTLLENRQFVGRFLDEAKVVVRLSHPNIARVYSMGEVSGQYYFAMEYVQGKTISRFMHRLRQKKERLSLGHILLLGEKVCEGLAYAHEAKDDGGAPLHLVHRDLSPANVCVSYRGEVKIIDFGAAQSRVKEEQTAPRVVIGNLTYMSPEQARKKLVDHRADLYALGVVLWELLVWNPLPQKGDPVERWRKAASPVWAPPSLHAPSLPRELDLALLRALHRDPQERYPDARAMGAELRKLREQFGRGETEQSLGALLEASFGAEKTAEDMALAEILRGVPDSEVQTQVLSEEPLVPPTALAFEHSAVYTHDPELPTDADDEDSEVTPARISFGTAHQGDEAEEALMREIEGAREAPPRPRAKATLSSSERRFLWVLGTGAFVAALVLGFAAVVLLAPG